MFFIYFPIALIIMLILYYFLSQKQEQLYRDYFLYYNDNMDERFEEIYLELTNENVEELERNRKSIMRKRMLIHIFFITLIGTTILNFKNIQKINGYLIMPILQFSIPIYILAIRKKDNNIEFYKRIYKNTITSKFVELYNPELIYKSSIDKVENIEIKREYSAMKFSVESFDILEIKNCIYGELENSTIMNMYDISLNFTGGSENSTTVFKGTYVMLNIGQNIPTNVKISKNKIINKEKNKVELDSSKFEEYFDVYSDDKVLAVRILTSDVMQMLIDFYEKYYINFEIAIQDNKIHINLNTGEMFKVPIWKKAINKEEIYLQYVILEFVNELSNKINEVINKIEF